LNISEPAANFTPKNIERYFAQVDGSTVIREAKSKYESW
jgi:hypothetical protein